MALGLKGGFALARSGLTPEVAASLAAAVLLAVAVPLASYALLRRSLNGFDAAAIAATYGSVSAVTFITAVQYLDTHGLPYGGHMAAAMALMESPAIVLAVLLANRLRRQQGAAEDGAAARRAARVADRRRAAVAAGRDADRHADRCQREAAMQPFTGDLFKGMLAFFLLDMGLSCARQLGALRGAPRWLLGYALAAPMVHAAVALALGRLLGLEPGNTALLLVLAASASYIAVPAVVRHAIPEAQPGLYLGLSLGVTFPFNILVGIPSYIRIAHGG